MAHPAGIIITVSVLVAAGIAAYENPHIREWIERTRYKIAMGLHSLGDEIEPRRRRSSQMDASMTEEKGELADVRRRQAIADIMERGRIMEERRKRRKLSEGLEKSRPSFDTLVDGDGMLIADGSQEPEPVATTSSVQVNENIGMLKSRHLAAGADGISLSPASLLSESHLSHPSGNQTDSQDPFESCYEREMRNSWNLPLSDRSAQVEPSHASESLIDLTPTTEEIPDPDYSIPSAGYSDYHMDQSDYFSVAASRSSSHTLADQEPEYYYAHPSQPLVPVVPRQPLVPTQLDMSISSAPSIAGSMNYVLPSEVGDGEDDVFSEIGDGIRTPASAWTEVGSNFSGEN